MGLIKISMNINIRRAIALAFIIAFFITAPLLILYTAGFRYNIKRALVQRTGTLIVKTIPKDATVLLNDAPFSSTTPIRENNILPDEYNINIVKDGYYPWTKKLSIRPQETTFIEDIILFPKLPSEKINDNKINFLSFSPGGSYALFTTKDFNQDFLYLLNLNNFRQKLIFNNDKSWSKISALWSKDDSKALINIDGNYLVATTIFPQQKINLSDQISPKLPTPDIFKWDETDSNTLYSLNDNTISIIDLLSLTSERIFTATKDEKISDFLVRGNELYLLENINGTPLLTKQLLSGTAKTAAIGLKSANYYFHGFFNGYLAFGETNHETLFLANSDLDKIVFSKENVQTIEPSDKDNYLLVTTNQEISFIKLDEAELTERNVTRYGDGLTETHWTHSTTNYLFALQNTKITILELDERDKRFTLELPEHNVKTFTVNANDEALIFLRDDYLYQLPIK